MMQLQVGGQRYPIAAGEMVVGSGAECAVPLRGGQGVEPRHAIVQALPDGSAAIRPVAPGSAVLVNGVRHGDDPIPILHGDKIQIGDYELLVIDPERAGDTRFFDSSAFERFSPPQAAAPAASGGRLVCLTDGREYQVGGALAIGRDASADVVVPGSDVSRRHAQIVATEQGYVLVDTSTNGTYLNGSRIEGSRLLRRADVIRIGDDEFRFYADEMPAGSRPTPRSAAPAAPAEPAGPPAGAEQRLSDTYHGLPKHEPVVPPGPITPVSLAEPPIASLLVRTGGLKGKRLMVRVPVVNIGRADHNDLVIPDASVSASHAKLTRREGIWLLSDLGSTNGTYVDGERIVDETPLGPGSTLQFGEVTTLFESTDDITGVQARTRAMAGVPAAAEPEPAAPPPRHRPIRAPIARKRGGPPRWVVLLFILVVVAAIAFMVLTR